MNHGSAAPRVLHIITRMIVGGAQWNTLYTCRGLRERGTFRATVLSGAPDGTEGELLTTAEDYGVPVDQMKGLVREMRPIRDLRTLLGMIRYLRRGRFQIVHTHSSKAGILGRLAAWLAGVPVVIHTVHGWSFHDRMGGLNRAFSILLERIAARVTDALIVVTETDLEKGLRAGVGTDRQYFLIRSGVDLDRFRSGRVEAARLRKELGLAPDSRLVGTMGRLAPQKSPLDFVRMAEMLTREETGVEFIYLGDGALREEFEREVRNRGLADRLHLLGMRTDVDRILGLLDVYVQTSLWEGLPRAFLEATAAGVPVVASRVDGAVEFFEDGVSGFLVPPGDVSTMTRRVVGLLRDPHRGHRLAENARERMGREFSAEAMVEGVERLYRRLMGEKAMAPADTKEAIPVP